MFATEQHVLDPPPTQPHGGWEEHLKVDGQSGTVHVCNRATSIRPPIHPPGLKNYKVFKSQITKTQIVLQWAMSECKKLDIF